MNKSKVLIRTIFFIGAALSVMSLVIMLVMTPEPKLKSSKLDQYSGVDARGSNIGGDFVLIDSSGNKFDSQNFRGKVLLIYFGFTYCPDICPASLVEMVHAIDEVNKGAANSKFSRSNVVAADLVPIFITIDPKRDNEDKLHSYFKNFDNRIIALTGDEKQVYDVAKKFKVYHAIDRSSQDDKSRGVAAASAAEVVGSSNLVIKNNKNYMINHSSFYYLLGKDGKIIKYYTPGTEGINMGKDILKYLGSHTKSHF